MQQPQAAVAQNPELDELTDIEETDPEDEVRAANAEAPMTEVKRKKRKGTRAEKNSKVAAKISK